MPAVWGVHTGSCSLGCTHGCLKSGCAHGCLTVLGIHTGAPVCDGFPSPGPGGSLSLEVVGTQLNVCADVPALVSYGVRQTVFSIIIGDNTA